MLVFEKLMSVFEKLMSAFEKLMSPFEKLMFVPHTRAERDGNFLFSCR